MVLISNDFPIQRFCVEIFSHVESGFSIYSIALKNHDGGTFQHNFFHLPATKSGSVSFYLDMPAFTTHKVGDLNVDSPLRQKIAHSLEKTYDGVREVMGDGNCYYRAVGFALVERYVLPHQTVFFLLASPP